MDLMSTQGHKKNEEVVTLHGILGHNLSYIEMRSAKRKESTCVNLAVGVAEEEKKGKYILRGTGHVMLSLETE